MNWESKAFFPPQALASTDGLVRAMYVQCMTVHTILKITTSEIEVDQVCHEDLANNIPS